jgi:hypothetical protein
MRGTDMRYVLVLIFLLLCASVAESQTVDTVYFGRRYYALGVESQTDGMILGDADTLYQFTPTAGYTYVLKRVYMRVKNYTNDTSSLAVGLYTVNASTKRPDDSVWSVCRQMSAVEQTGDDQTIYSDCSVSLTVGTGYTFASGENTNGMRRIMSSAGYYIGGPGDTTTIPDSALASASGTVSRQTSPAVLDSKWDEFFTTSTHPVIWGLVERTSAGSSVKRIIIVE